MYAGELQGILIATDIAQEVKARQPTFWKINVYTDSQAAIRAVAQPGTQSGQYILKDIVKKVDTLGTQDISINIYWIAAHEDVAGNELADQAAKQAARAKNSRPEERRLLTSTYKGVLRKRIMKEWEADWENATAGRITFRLEPKPNPKMLDKHQGIRKPLNSLIIQIRIGKIGLAKYLYSIERADTESCSCDRGI